MHTLQQRLSQRLSDTHSSPVRWRKIRAMELSSRKKSMGLINSHAKTSRCSLLQKTLFGQAACVRIMRMDSALPCKKSSCPTAETPRSRARFDQREYVWNLGSTTTQQQTSYLAEAKQRNFQTLLVRLSHVLDGLSPRTKRSTCARSCHSEKSW